MSTCLKVALAGVVLTLSVHWISGRVDALARDDRIVLHRHPRSESFGVTRGASHRLTDKGLDDGSRADWRDPLVAPIHVAGLPPTTSADDPSGEPPYVLQPDDLVAGKFTHDRQALFHPHGTAVCASGCAVSNHPTEELTPALFKQLLADCALTRLDETNHSFETLLFFGRQARDLLETQGSGPLNSEQAGTLRRELARTHARIAIRVIDEHGETRSWLRPTRVPFDRRHVFDMDVDRVQPLVTSGTVKRVGLHHLWTRL